MHLDTIEARGFAPRVTAIAARCVATCYQQCFRPDNRPLIGLALFSVTPEAGSFSFHAEARALRDDELPGVLLDWLEPRIPQQGAIVSWSHWHSLPRKLAALAGDHPTIATAAAETEGRWRDLPYSLSWHLKHANAQGVPCLCLANDPEPCAQQLPACFLPDPDFTERSLVDEAMKGWVSWARLFGDFDDADHPARRAITAWRDWAPAAQR
ncbi:hypothetical protein BV96_01255 [Sphingomonas paucimobilis]|nr:hypothetical protein BV96_01255 [Sphingomonas paucimobilis]